LDSLSSAEIKKWLELYLSKPTYKDVERPKKAFFDRRSLGAYNSMNYHETAVI